MEAHAHHAAHARSGHSGHGSSLDRTAFLATVHCLTGCAIGEILGMVIGTALGWGNAATIGLAVSLAFLFGYSLTMLPLLRAGLALVVAIPLAFASDSLSIAVMELVDNGVMLGWPGAMDAGLSSGLFWGALAIALAVAFAFAYPLNRYLIARGRGHAVVHAHQGPDGSERPAAAPRSFLALGLAAFSLTVAVTVGAALLLEEDHRAPAPVPMHETPHSS